MLARKIILGFGFAVLLPMLIHYGIDVFAPSFDWRARGEESQRYYREQERLKTQERDATGDEKARVRQRLEQLEQRHDQEQEGIRGQRDQSGRIHFFVGVPIGILMTLLGSFIRVQAIGGGLMLGGIFTFTEGCFWYWTDLPRVGRFLVLLVAFGVLLWIGYQRLSELKQPAKPS